MTAQPAVLTTDFTDFTDMPHLPNPSNQSNPWFSCASLAEPIELYEPRITRISRICCAYQIRPISQIRGFHAPVLLNHSALRLSRRFDARSYFLDYVLRVANAVPLPDGNHVSV